MGFGVTDLDGFAAPSGTVVKGVTVRGSIENVKYRDESGQTIRNIPGKVKTTEQTIELIGGCSLSLLVPGEFTEGEYKVVRVRNRENNDGVPESTVVRKKYESYP